MKGNATEKLMQQILNFIHYIFEKQDFDCDFLAKTIYKLKKVEEWCFFTLPVGTFSFIKQFFY
jgi:hypothetical protein